MIPPLPGGLDWTTGKMKMKIKIPDMRRVCLFGCLIVWASLDGVYVQETLERGREGVIDHDTEVENLFVSLGFVKENQNEAEPPVPPLFSFSSVLPRDTLDSPPPLPNPLPQSPPSCLSSMSSLFHLATCTTVGIPHEDVSISSSLE